MEKRRNRNIKKERGLNPFQLAIVYCLSLLYYYGIMSIVVIVVTIIVVVISRNIQLITGAHLTDMLPIIIGAIIFYPSIMLDKYLMEYWKKS